MSDIQDVSIIYYHNVYDMFIRNKYSFICNAFFSMCLIITYKRKDSFIASYIVVYFQTKAKPLGKGSIIFLLDLISKHKVLTTKCTNATNKLKDYAWKSKG